MQMQTKEKSSGVSPLQHSHLPEQGHSVLST
jgi:hypothetical protein